MALDEWGQIFSWGSDSMGQLGSNLGSYAQDKPKIVKFLATKNVIQIACGSHHSIALTNSKCLFFIKKNVYKRCTLRAYKFNYTFYLCFCYFDHITLRF